MRVIIALYQALNALFTIIFCGLILSSPHAQFGWEKVPALLLALIPLVLCILWSEGLRRKYPIRVSLVILHILYLIEVMVILLFLVRQGNTAGIVEFIYMTILGVLTIVLGVYLIRKKPTRLSMDDD